MENAITSPDSPCNKLAVPATSYFVGHVPCSIRDVTEDLKRVFTAPAARLETQRTGVPSTMVYHLQDISVWH